MASFTSPGIILALIGLAGFGGSARADEFNLTGVVAFTNIQGGLQRGEPVPYVGVGYSRLIGPNVQTGSILPTSPPAPVEGMPGVFTFTGVVGPHPSLPGGPAVHVITTARGTIDCTWEAVFTLRFNLDGTMVFSGDGDFTVTGGTGRYRGATGSFRTLFQSAPVPVTADEAGAEVTQTGTIDRR